MNTITPDALADLVVANVKTNKWLSATFDVEGMPAKVGIKAFGRWVQIIECCGMRSDVPETKTNKALRAGVLEQLGAIKRSLG